MKKERDLNIDIDRDRDNRDRELNESSDNSSTIEKKIDTWKPEHNIILSEWADKAMCYRWLHFRSHIRYNTLNIGMTIPVIIISTLTGTANFAIDRFNTNYASAIIGGFNILAGIISTIQHFLKISELNESHKVASVSWDKFYRNIKIELTKCPEDRLSVHHMLKIYKEEYDRLMETSPTINDIIIHEFHNTFKNTTNFVKVKKPEICDELVPTNLIIYKECAYKAMNTYNTIHTFMKNKNNSKDNDNTKESYSDMKESDSGMKESDSGMKESGSGMKERGSDMKERGSDRMRDSDRIRDNDIYSFKNNANTKNSLTNDLFTIFNMNTSKNDTYKDFNNIDIEAEEKFIHTIKEKRKQSIVDIEDIDDIVISSI